MLDPKEEAKFQELKDKCRELHITSPPEIMIGLQVRDKDGNLIFDDIQRGHSWTRNFYNIMFGVLTHATSNGGASLAAGSMNAKNSAGTVANSTTKYAGTDSGYNAGEGYRGGAGVSGAGIVVGTGDTAFGVGQYALATAISHGNGSTQLYYMENVIATPAYTAGTKTWASAISRIFNNNSGASITVKETGLFYARSSSTYNQVWGGAGPFLTERSVLSPTVTVPNGAQLTVTYSISMDFSAID